MQLCRTCEREPLSAYLHEVLSCVCSRDSVHVVVSPLHAFVSTAWSLSRRTRHLVIDGIVSACHAPRPFNIDANAYVQVPRRVHVVVK